MTPEQSQRIKNVLSQKITGVCSLCGVRNWIYGENLVTFQTGHAPESPPSSAYQRSLASLAEAALGKWPAPGPTLLLLPLMCHNCGNTHLLNVYQLQIADLWGFPIRPALAGMG